VESRLPPDLPSAHLNDPIAKHLRSDFPRLSIDQTVGEALDSLRAKPPEGRIIYLYVTDADGKLLGVVPTRRLLLSPPDKTIAQIMVTRIIAIPQSATVLEACEFFTLHRFLAFPVVDDERRIVGTVDVELYTDELRDLSEPEIAERADDLFQLIGVHLTESQQASPLCSFRSRFPWLLANIAGGILAAFLSGMFEAELQKAVALALFIPVVLALAESVSIQSVSLGLLRLKNHTPSWGELARKLSREVLTGLLLGTACALLVGMTAALWKGDWRVTLCLVVGITGGVTAAAAIGLAMPYLLRLLKQDPQVAAGPIALAIADMLTLLLYFNLARLLI
jgi:magnesium transporter